MAKQYAVCGTWIGFRSHGYFGHYGITISACYRVTLLDIMIVVQFFFRQQITNVAYNKKNDDKR